MYVLMLMLVDVVSFSLHVKCRDCVSCNVNICFLWITVMVVSAWSSYLVAALANLVAETD